MVTDALGYTPPTADTNTWRGITDSVSTTDSTISGSATAVKAAYDKAVSAYNLANGKTANTGTVTTITAGAGLTTNTTNKQITTSGTISCNLSSQTQSTLASASVSSTANRQYAVNLDKNGYLSVNVPWTDTDTNTTYSTVTTNTAGLCPKLAGGTTKYLRADGTWATPPDTNTTYDLSTYATQT